MTWQDIDAFLDTQSNTPCGIVLNEDDFKELNITLFINQSICTFRGIPIYLGPCQKRGTIRIMIEKNDTDKTL